MGNPKTSARGFLGSRGGFTLFASRLLSAVVFETLGDISVRIVDDKT
jgi:hypothetical protein